MEVHKHPNHVTHKKKWFEYALEFLMIFLAVFLGFLAENVREDFADKKKEKVFIKNLYEDLKSDTLSYLNFAKANEDFSHSVDTLITLMKIENRNARMNKIYFLARMATIHTNDIFLYFNDRTFVQMKNSGQLRLLSNQEVADSISSYYNSLDLMLIQDKEISNRISDYMKTVGDLFDAEVFFRIFKETKEPTEQNLKLKTTDPIIINRFLIATQYFYGSRNVQKKIGFELSKKAKQLIELIKKEYNLEKE